MNNIIAQSLPGGSGIDGENGKENDVDEEKEILQDVKSLIKSTTYFVIRQDKEKLEELLEGFKKYDDDEVVEELKMLIEKLLNNHDNFDMVNDRDAIRAIESFTTIPKSKLLRFKMLLNNMQKNRYRVHSILSRLDEIEDEDRFAGTVKNLAREGLISDEQYEKATEKRCFFRVEKYCRYY